MKSRLLALSELEALSESGNVRTLVAAMVKTPYRPALEAALVRFSGSEAIVWATRDDLQRTVAQVRRFYRGAAAEKIAIILRAYDVRNLRTVLRELSSQAAPDELGPALWPAFELSFEMLHELAQVAGPRPAIDLLASMGSPYARPLVHLRAERPGAGAQEMELRLEQWYFKQAFDALSERADETLEAALRLDADLTNLHTVLRLVASPEEQAALETWLGGNDVRRLFVGPGRLTYDFLAHVATQSSLGKAVTLLSETPYEGALASGLEAYRQNGRLSSFERELYRLRLRQHAHLITRQPLGVGVVLGYLALKMNEVNNLRWIANSIAMAVKPDGIRAELVRAS